MATYNGAPFLGSQLDSLAAQTRLPDELVICDDGSADDTLELLQAFAKRAPFPVRIFENKQRQGYRKNFLNAGKQCRGDLIFFSDQDDEWLTEKIEKMARLFDKPTVLLAYHNAMVINQWGEALFTLYDNLEQRSAISSTDPDPFHFSLGFTQAYRRRLHRFDDLWSKSCDHVAESERLAHDQWFFLLATILGITAYFDEPLVRYRQHSANAYGVKPADGSAGWRGLKRALIGPVWADLSLSVGAMSRSEIAAEIAARVEGSEREVARKYAQSFFQLATRLKRRYQSSYSAGFSQRAAALLLNVRENAYRGGDQWNFQKGWIVGDTLRAFRGSTHANAPDTKGLTSGLDHR
jgi:glycosyltransferase involved in cell wall biosynthesis